MARKLSPEDRRRSRRVLFPIRCSIKRGSGKGSTTRGVIENISLHGGLLRLPGRVNKGARLRLSFALGGERFSDVPGLVVWTRVEREVCDCGVDFPDSLAGRLQQALLHTAHQSVLVVEADVPVRAELERHLGSAGYLTWAAGGLKAAARLLEDRPFDLVVIDRTLPDGSGPDLIKSLRADPSHRATPVILLSADQAGPAPGADQCLAKPVDYVEFLFSAAALLQRAAGADEAGAISFERGKIDPGAHIAWFDDREVTNLDREEFDLLYRLIAARPRALSRREVAPAQARRIRKKLGHAGARIVSVPGKGYRFV